MLVGTRAELWEQAELFHSCEARPVGLAAESEPMSLRVRGYPFFRSSLTQRVSQRHRIAKTNTKIFKTTVTSNHKC